MGRLTTLVLVGAMVLLIADSSMAFAQTASQVTPNFQPRTAPAGEALVFSGQPGLGAPPGAESLTVLLSGVVVEGGKPDLAQADQAAQTALSGHRVSVADIFAKARDLEAAYNNAGYVLARVVVPAQKLVDGGRLKLDVVDGFIERIDADGLPEPIRSRILAIVGPLLHRPGVTMGEIERRLLLAGDTPGVAMKTALSSGKEPGGAVLVVSAKLESITSFVGADNTLPASLGTWDVLGGVDFNSLLGLGETVYVRAAGHPDGGDATGIGNLFSNDPRFRLLTAGIVLPVGLDGMTFNLEGTVTQSTPEPDAGIQSTSQFEKVSARLRYPVIRSRAVDLNLGLTFDVQNEDEQLITGAGSVPLFADRLRVLRLSSDARWAPSWGGVVTGSATLSLGLDALGARSASGATPVPLSRQGADDTFKKLELAVDYSQNLAPHLALSLDARAQSSFGDPLVNSEQFGIANFNELSTFDAGALAGDSGWMVRAELAAPFDQSSSDFGFAIAPYAFAAAGGLHLVRPTALEAADVNAASLGAGVRLGGSVGEVSPSLTLEYGRAFRDDGPDSNRFTLVSSVRF